MVSQIVPLVLAGLLAVEAAVDFTPLPHKKPVEGGSVDEIAFQYGSKVVTYSPPFQWQTSGDAGRAVFRPVESQAEAVIEARKKPEITAFDPDVVKALKSEIQSTLPRELQKVEWADDEVSPVIWNRHPSYRITVSYSSYAQRFTKTVIVCNFARMQLRFELATRESEFKKLYEEFRRSLFTFDGVD
jgi:ABC-type amino acid transport substrate-binding protein